VTLSAASVAAAIASTSAPAAGPDSTTANAAQSSQADGTASSHAPVAAPSQDLLVAFGASPAIAGVIGTPDQNPTSNPALPFGVAPAANAGNLSALAGVAPIGPLSSAPNTATAVRALEQASATESDPASIALPAQTAAKFAAAMRATDDGTSDLGPDTGLASAAGTSDTTKNTNDQPGAIQANFNPSVLSPVQAAPAVPASPQHTAVAAVAVPLAGIPIAIAARVEAGEKHFEIRLDPPDLGRIEVTLNVDSSGHATSHLVVDRADTLDLLRRDAPALERALQSAGLTTDDSSLQFSLRNQSFAGQDEGTPAPLAPVSAPAPTDDVAPIDAAVRRYGAMAGLGSGVDIRV
jgi:flagellar hook-length control protein FliK